MRAEEDTVTVIDGVLEITKEATTVREESLISAFGSQSARLAARLHQLRREDWDRVTRCPEWNVRQLVQHLVTVTERAIPLLDRELGPVRLTFSEMDPRVTPDAWVRADGRTSTDTLLARYRGVTAEVLQRAARLSDEGARFSVLGPIGRVPWQLFLLHGLWDSWIHERDIYAGTSDQEGDEDEIRLVSGYGLFLAAEAVRLGGGRLSAVVSLTGRGEAAWLVVVSETTSVRRVPPGRVADLTGPAVPIVESLSGRGDPLARVARGDGQVASALSALGHFFQSSA